MDENTRKSILRKFTYGLYILTSCFEDDITAATVTWVTQASFDPPRICVGIRRDSHSHTVVKQSGKFILHLPSEDQKSVASAFFKKTEMKNGKINGLSYKLAESGIPILDDLPAYLICEVVNQMDGGDHTIFLATVQDAVLIKDVPALDLPSTGWFYGG